MSDPRQPDPESRDDSTLEARGTLFILLLYLMVVAGMWGAMYWLLVSR